MVSMGGTTWSSLFGCHRTVRINMFYALSTPLQVRLDEEVAGFSSKGGRTSNSQTWHRLHCKVTSSPPCRFVGRGWVLVTLS